MGRLDVANKELADRWLGIRAQRRGPLCLCFAFFQDFSCWAMYCCAPPRTSSGSDAPQGQRSLVPESSRWIAAITHERSELARLLTRSGNRDGGEAAEPSFSLPAAAPEAKHPALRS